MPELPQPLVAITGTMPIGGASTFLINLAWGMKAHGHQLILIVMGKNNPYREEFLATGAILHELNRDISIYEDRIAEAYRIVSSYKPRAVLSCLSAESFEILRYLPHGVQRMGIVQAHDPGVYRMIKVYAPWIDTVIGVSDSIRRHLNEMPEFFGKRIEYVPYGIEFNDVAAESQQVDQRHAAALSSRKCNPLRVVYAGRLVEEQKCISRIVSVVKSLADGSGTFQFTIVGSGPEEDWVKNQVGSLPGVVCRGELNNREVKECFSQHDVFLLLSDYEGLPLAMLEAMGVGCVPVISDLESGIRDVVTGDCGKRIPGGDANLAMEALLMLARDRNLVAQMSVASKGKVKHEFSAAKMAGRYLELVEFSFGDANSATSLWATDLKLVATPLYIKNRWRYRQPVRSIRRWRKWMLRRRSHKCMAPSAGLA